MSEVEQLRAAIERVRAIAERHGVKSWTEEIFAALDGVPEPGGGNWVVIGKENRTDEHENWAITAWEPDEIDEAREKFPSSAFEVVTIFGLPVEGENDDY